MRRPAQFVRLVARADPYKQTHTHRQRLRHGGGQYPHSIFQAGLMYHLTSRPFKLLSSKKLNRTPVRFKYYNPLWGTVNLVYSSEGPRRKLYAPSASSTTTKMTAGHMSGAPCPVVGSSEPDRVGVGGLLAAGVGTGVCAGEAPSVGVLVAVDVGACVGEGLGVLVAVDVGACVGERLGVLVAVGVGACVGDGLGVLVAVDAGACVGEGLGVGVLPAVGVGVLVGVDVGACAGDRLGVPA